MKIFDDEFVWSEKYRPDTVEECILPPRLKKYFQGVVDSGQIPGMLLAGGPGVGKTTVAEAMCKQMNISYLFVNASEENGVNTYRTKIKNYASTVSLVSDQKVILLDEADLLSSESQDVLRGVIQEVSQTCTFILTCNFKSKLKDALHSRSAVVDFTLRNDEKLQMQAQFFGRVEAILKNENVKYDEKTLVRIIKKYSPDNRRTLNELQRLAAMGDIDESVFNTLSEVRNVHELYTFLKEKDFAKARKWVVENGDVDVASIYRKLYDSLKSYLEPGSIPQAVLIINKYQVNASVVADQEINLVACLVELMVDCQYTAF